MVVTKLNKILKSFTDDKSSVDSMLVDGKAGCGKTYTITSYFKDDKDKKSPNYFYISLFGLNSLNSLMAIIAERIGSFDMSLLNGTLFFNTTLNKKVFNKSFIIFDDLERIGKDFDLATVGGVFDDLKNLGFRIICIVDSTKISDTKQFAGFREKSFDSIYSVEPDYLVLNDIIGAEDRFVPSESIIRDANSNWRIVIRAYKYFNELEKSFHKVGYNPNQATKLEDLKLFRVVLLSTVCVYEQSLEEPKFGEGNSYTKTHYDYDVEKFGKAISNKFYELLLKEGACKEFQDYIRNMIPSIQANDFDLFVENYVNTKKDDVVNQYPFNKALFFYDDEGQTTFRKIFIERINDFDFCDRRHSEILVSVLRMQFSALSEDEKRIIEKRVLATTSKEKFGEIRFMFRALDSKTDSNLQSYLDSIDAKLYESVKRDTKREIVKAFEDKNYQFLTDYLYNNKYSIGDNLFSILSLFSSYDFFIPDLSKEIDYDSWGYCHEIARFVAKDKDYAIKFVNVLNKQCALSNSKALRLRCKALIDYNLSGLSGLPIDFL